MKNTLNLPLLLLWISINKRHTLESYSVHAFAGLCESITGTCTSTSTGRCRGSSRFGIESIVRSHHRKQSHRKSFNLRGSHFITINYAAPKDIDKGDRMKPSTPPRKRRVSPKLSKRFNSFSWNTALTIVPPDDAWDQIQRARHFAGDVTYSKWPPAIRLIHPFITDDIDSLQDSALEIAKAVIEQHSVGPFPISLSRWSIVPLTESMITEITDDQSVLDINYYHNDGRYGQDSASLMLTKQQQDDRKVQELIAREEKIGKEKLAIRLEKQKRKNDLEKRQQQNESGNATQVPSTERQIQDIERSDEHHSQNVHDEFNGPCVLCLEPDTMSQRKLQELRYLLIDEMFPSHAECCSPSSLYVTDINIILNQIKKLKKKTTSKRRKELLYEFRPTVPIASFPTVDSAIPVARKLRNSWTSIHFNVTDLQIMSSPSFISTGSSNKSSKSSSSYRHLSNENDDFLSDDNDGNDMSHFRFNRDNDVVQSSLDDIKNREFGCDALIALIGEEVQMDDELNQEIVTTLIEKGEKGGGYQLLFLEPKHHDKRDSKDSIMSNKISSPTTSKQAFEENKLANEKENANKINGMEATSSPYLEQWLDEDDDDYDEGTVVVIGRTHLLTGAMRHYVGMPAASNLLDHKSRSSNSINHSSSKRRTAVDTSNTHYNVTDNS